MSDEREYDGFASFPKGRLDDEPATDIQRYVIAVDLLAARLLVGDKEYTGCVDVVTYADAAAWAKAEYERGFDATRGGSAEQSVRISTYAIDDYSDGPLTEDHELGPIGNPTNTRTFIRYVEIGGEKFFAEHYIDEAVLNERKRIIDGLRKQLLLHPALLTVIDPDTKGDTNENRLHPPEG